MPKAKAIPITIAKNNPLKKAVILMMIMSIMRAPARGHSAKIQMAPNGPAGAAAELLEA